MTRLVEEAPAGPSHSFWSNRRSRVLRPTRSFESWTFLYASRVAPVVFFDLDSKLRQVVSNEPGRCRLELFNHTVDLQERCNCDSHLEFVSALPCLVDSIGVVVLPDALLHRCDDFSCVAIDVLHMSQLFAYSYRPPDRSKSVGLCESQLS
jgi:hypothetical protein